MSAGYKPNYGDEEPIAAFATTAGRSALTLIRCAGRGSIELVSSVFSPSKIKDAPGNTVIHGWIVEKEQSENKKIDEVLVSVFRAPKSYTGEDSLDICCHGGHSSGAAVMTALKTAGFREALPGEFTFRAFMNGKLDLTRSESVMELVCAKTETGRTRAVSRLCGSLEKEINEIKQSLVKVLSAAEIFLDYSEDEIGADDDEIAGKLPNREIAHNALDQLKKLSASWQLERIYQEGVTAAIAGRPNAGKSSLFNLFLKEDRSIVTETPGTTRDWIEAWVSIEGVPVRMIDTAGLRETDDPVEKIGVERSREILSEADIVLYLLDGECGLTEEDKEYIDTNAAARRIFVWNKADKKMPPHPFPSERCAPVCVSAKTGEGLAELASAVASAIFRQAQMPLADNEQAAIGTMRQKNLVDSACRLLEEALAMTEKEEPLDLIAPLIREAVNSLGEITGEVSAADILEEMFSRFCVGK